MKKFLALMARGLMTRGVMTLTTSVLMTAVFTTAVFTTAAHAEGYGIRPGDTLKIEVLEDATLNRAALVDPTGNISLPEAGTIKVAGQSVDAIAAVISTRIAGSFAAPPHVYVSLAQVAVAVAGTGGPGISADVYVIGEANKPGRLGLKPGTTVLQAFAEMGGFTKFAATRRIQIRRTDAKTGAATTFQLNYDAILAGTGTNANMTLKSGDVIIVPQRKLFE